jgi:hypothetical protein
VKPPGLENPTCEDRHSQQRRKSPMGWVSRLLSGLEPCSDDYSWDCLRFAVVESLRFGI